MTKTNNLLKILGLGIPLMFFSFQKVNGQIDKEELKIDKAELHNDLNKAVYELDKGYKNSKDKAEIINEIVVD